MTTSPSSASAPSASASRETRVRGRVYISPTLMSPTKIPMADLPRDTETGNIVVYCKECGVPIRPRNTHKTDYPHTYGYGARGKCSGCYSFGTNGIYLVRSQLPEAVARTYQNKPRRTHGSLQQTSIPIETLLEDSAENSN